MKMTKSEQENDIKEEDQDQEYSSDDLQRSLAQRSNSPSKPADSEEGVKVLRHRFFKRMRQEVLKWGSELIDVAWVYYPATQDPNTVTMISDLKLVTDRIFLPKTRCTGPDFIELVGSQWWQSRAQVIMDEGEEACQAVCGFYGRYLGSSGFSLILEFQPRGVTHLWRVDARARGVDLKTPKNDADFYDQFGTYIDLHYGWRWLLQTHLESDRLVVAEVEPGYMIGVRRGAIGNDEDPAEREDPEIESVFSRFDVERFDTLEFLNHSKSELYPFTEERYSEWLDPQYVELLKQGHIEMFTLSHSNSFFEAVEEVAERRKVEVSWTRDEENPQLHLSRGPLSLTLPFSFPYLWSLHTGRYFYEGATEFFREHLERLHSASELYFQLLSSLKGHTLQIERGDSLSIIDPTGVQRAEVSLISWTSMGAFDGGDGVRQFLYLLGYHDGQWSQPNHPLDQCPLCENSAQILKALRPQNHTPSTPLRASFDHDELWGYYTLSCHQHQTPIFWADSSEIEQAIRDQTHHVIQIESEVQEEHYSLLWARELAGHLLNKETRETLRERGALYAYAFYPDLIALSLSPFEGDLLDHARQRAQLLADQKRTQRLWSLNWSTELR